MSLTLMITPGGHLRLESDPGALPALTAERTDALQGAFASSSVVGLLALVGQELGQELPPALVFWRGVARRLFEAICALGEAGFSRWGTIAPPAEEELSDWVEQAPPMSGLEYLSIELLQRLWAELRDLVAQQAHQYSGGPAAYLRAISPLWHLLGRVTFHLAENKRDPQRPFAFLATFTHRLSGQARLQHLPLSEALKTYAAAKDFAQLEKLLEPVRRASARSNLVRELLDEKTIFAPQAWSVRQAYRFLMDAPKMEEAGLVVRLPDWWSPRRPPRPQVQVHLGSRPASVLGLDTLLDFSAELTLDGEPLTEKERRNLLSGSDGLVLLRGKWVEANPQRLEQALDHWKRIAAVHPDGISFVEGMRLLAGVLLEGPEADEAQTASWSQITAGDWLRQTLQRMRQPEQGNGCRPGRDLQATLRPYQVDGVSWLWFMTGLGLGACLADDMGLGKTIQIIDLLLQRKQRRHSPSIDESENGGTSLLIVPASLLGNWRQELVRFAPSLRTFFAHRSETPASDLDRAAADPVRQLASFDLVVTTYGLARRQSWLTAREWSLVVLDEAQAIKNASSAQAKTVKKLHAAARIVLTGTPVENHLGDLWSLMDFCCPGLLGSAKQFKQYVKQLNDQQDAKAYGSLRRLVRPYILRRLKTDPSVAPDLPEKTEMRLECGLTRKQAALYEQAVSDLTLRLENSEGIARRGLVLAALMHFKQICNHPSQYLSQGSFGPEESGKFERLRLVCEPIAARQEKVLVFTQFQTLTEPLADFLAGVFGRVGLVLHGGTPVRQRPELVRRFQDDGGPPFFVISLKAGGSGLNLTAATHVVHFDRWWNPAVEDQATDRAFRIGQKRNVLVHKFVCRGTVEERIDAMIHDKRELADRILNEGSETLLTEMNNEDLLRFVALDITRACTDE